MKLTSVSGQQHVHCTTIPIVLLVSTNCCQEQCQFCCKATEQLRTEGAHQSVSCREWLFDQKLVTSATCRHAMSHFSKTTCCVHRLSVDVLHPFEDQAFLRVHVICNKPRSQFIAVRLTHFQETRHEHFVTKSTRSNIVIGQQHNNVARPRLHKKYEDGVCC